MVCFVCVFCVCVCLQAATNFSTNAFQSHGGAIVLKDQKQSALNAAAAGCVMMCICNYAVCVANTHTHAHTQSTDRPTQCTCAQRKHEKVLHELLCRSQRWCLAAQPCTER